MAYTKQSFMGEYFRHLDRGGMSFPTEFRSIFNSNPLLFCDFEQGCLCLYNNEEIEKFGISQIERYEYDFIKGKLFITQYSWLKSLGLGDDVAVIGVDEGVEIWDRKKWEIEKRKDELPRRLFFEFGPDNPFTIVVTNGLEDYTEKSWEEKVKKFMIGINPNSKEGKRLQRNLFSKAYSFDNISEFLDWYYNDEGSRVLIKNRS